MGTIAEKLKYTQAAVNDIKEAIAEKGFSSIHMGKPLGEYGDQIRAIITPPFYDGTINVPNNYGKSVEWVDSCVYEFEDGDKFVYNSGIGYSICFTYEAKVFSAFFGSDYTDESGKHYTCSAPVRITTTGSADYVVRILDIRPLNNRQILFLWTYQLNAEATNWAPFYAQIITVKQDIDLLTTQLSSAISLLASGTHYVEGGNVAGRRAFLDMVPLKNDMSRVVELGLLLQQDTYTAAGVKSASALYWNDIRVTTTQLALNSTAWTNLCSVAPSADYNYLLRHHSNLYGWVYEYQTTSANHTVKIVARPDGRAVNNFVNSNIRVNGEYSKNSFSGCYILGVLEDGNILASGTDSTHIVERHSLRLFINEYDQLKNEWNQIAELQVDMPDDDYHMKGASKTILMPNNILLDAWGGNVWHIKKTGLKEYSASYLGKFDIHNYDTLHARSYQFDGLYSNKFFGIGQEAYSCLTAPYGTEAENDPYWLKGSITPEPDTFYYLASSSTLGEQKFYKVNGSVKHAFELVNGTAVTRRAFACKKISVEITPSVRYSGIDEYLPFDIKIKVCRNNTVIGEIFKAVPEAVIDVPFTLDLEWNSSYQSGFYEGDILSVAVEKKAGVISNNCRLRISIKNIEGILVG